MQQPDPPHSATAGRNALRQRMRERRSALDPASRLRAADALAGHLRPVLESRQGWIAGYWAVAGELPLFAVQSRLPAGLRWTLPVLGAAGRLQFRAWRPGAALATNRHGIPEPAEGAEIEPEELDLVLLPLLAFDACGHRLGQGGGHYDRSFGFRRGPADCTNIAGKPAKPLLIGIGYDWQEVEHIEPAPWDVALDLIATDAGIHHPQPPCPQHRPSIG